MHDAQKAVVKRFYRNGMNQRDLEAVMSNAAPTIRWFSVDARFARVWYEGCDAVRAFVAAMIDSTNSFEFTLKSVVADEQVPNVVIAEWTNAATMDDGACYANVGCTVFEFTPDTTVIIEIRQYFDSGPLAVREDWLAKVRAVSAGEG